MPEIKYLKETKPFPKFSDIPVGQIFRFNPEHKYIDEPGVWIKGYISTITGDAFIATCLQDGQSIFVPNSDQDRTVGLLEFKNPEVTDGI
jgi:hypothetical protein